MVFASGVWKKILKPEFHGKHFANINFEANSFHENIWISKQKGIEICLWISNRQQIISTSSGNGLHRIGQKTWTNVHQVQWHITSPHAGHNELVKYFSIANTPGDQI